MSENNPSVKKLFGTTNNNIPTVLSNVDTNGRPTIDINNKDQRDSILDFAFQENGGPGYTTAISGALRGIRILGPGNEMIPLPDNVIGLNFVSRPLLNLSDENVRLHENLSVGRNLDLEGTQITVLPDNLSVGWSLYLRGTQITNCPYVQNCGAESRTIYLDYNNKNIICIGCFRGNEKKAIEAISKKYQYNHEKRNKYIENVKECFAMWEKIKKGKANEC